MDSESVFIFGVVIVCIGVFTGLAVGIALPTRKGFLFKPGDFFRTSIGVIYKQGDDLGLEMSPGGRIISHGWVQNGTKMYYVELQPDCPNVESRVALPEYALIACTEDELADLRVDSFNGQVVPSAELARRADERRQQNRNHIDVIA